MTTKTSEAICLGHPDKIADQIADAVVDDIISQDKYGRCGIEVLVNSEFAVIAGEIRTSADLDIKRIVKQVIDEIGYKKEYGFCFDDLKIIESIREQSTEISETIEGEKITATDQGLVFGYACNETANYMPLSIDYAHSLVRRLDALRKTGEIPYLRPDGKAQVSVIYEGNRPIGISSIVIAAQHDPGICHEDIIEDISRKVINYCIDPCFITPDTRVFINQLGRFVEGGPKIDTGITGRKIICDTYGGIARIGGGALSGKDPTKLDKTGAYFGRHIAKSIVASGLADVCEMEIAFAFNEVDALHSSINTYGTAKCPESEILSIIGNNFDLSISNIIYGLDLLKPIYRAASAYGHFGDIAHPWETVRGLV
ncbi:MAG: S-adenosylmethionine synthase [Syntrophomonadaceae bacterium]|nr:S-adenosylmethionine synthase [Bacillota bacterium]